MLPYKSILVTGGCGFIGSNFLNSFVPTNPHTNFINIDCLNYCANIDNVLVQHLPNYTFYHDKLQDINLAQLLVHHSIDAVLHFAGQTHVDNSFTQSLVFTYDNIVATHILIERCKAYGNLKRFVYVSTDEVYGTSNTYATENTPMFPSTPYAATKASAELLIRSYITSFAFPAIIVRPNNIYGNNQFPEKVIPKFILLLLNDKPCTIHGTGTNMRSFLHVSDLCNALKVVLIHGQIGHVYNVASNDECNILDIAKFLVLEIKQTREFDNWIQFVPDRPFNDFRYLLNCDKIKQLGWVQNVSFIFGIRDTIDKSKKKCLCYY